MKKHFERLKDFDAYFKPVEDLQEKTFIGGTGLSGTILFNASYSET